MRLNPHCVQILIVVLAISLLAPFVRTSTNPLGRSGLSYSPQSSVLSATTDPRKYSFIYLSNGIPMVLVSDASTPQASAAVSVGVGSWGDPVDYPGLAHFLEHCLFLGSEAFPGENAYGSYLAANGGGSNAFTSQDRTVYYFTVDAPALGGALDRFSGFFTTPLINATSIHREVRAVNAEHAKNLQSDGWRAWQLLKHLSSPQSPMHGFSTGNSTTLDKPGVRSALLAFAARHYHAGNMVASIVGPQGVEELRGLAERAFSGIRAGPITSTDTLDLNAQPWVGESKEVLVEAFAGVGVAAERIDGLSPPPLQPYSTYPLQPLSPGIGRGLLAAFPPIGQGSDLTLTWPLNGEESAFGARVASAALITGALNDESEGGLQSLLKREGLIEGMSAGADLSTASLTLFSISFTLSPDAVEGIRGEAAAAASHPGKGVQALTLLLGRISTHLFSYLDTLEGELLNSTHLAWASMVSEAYGSGGSVGVERLRGGLGLSKEELEELELPLLSSSTSTSATPATLLQRGDWREGTQEALIQRAVTLASRTTYRHYYGVVPGAPPKAVEGVGGTLASWPTLPGDTMGRLWRESVAYGQAQFLYPRKELSVESRVMALVENLWLGLGPQDVLLPPSRRVYQPLAALRVLRQLVPGSAIGLLSSPLIGVLGGEGGASLSATSTTTTNTIGASGGGPQALLSPWGDDTPLQLPFSEPIYGTRYALLPLFSCIAQALASTPQIPATTTPRLPPPNPFIPTSFELVSHAPYHSALGIEEKAREVGGGGVSGDVGKGNGSPPILALSTTAQTYGWVRDVKVWWTPFIHLPSPRLAIGIEALFHSNHTYATPLDALLTQLYLSCAVEAATEFMSNPGKAGATLTPRFNGVTGGLEILGTCFTSTDSFCQPFLAAALPKALPNPGMWSTTLVATRLSLIAQGLADAEFQAQPYTQAFTLAALRSGEKVWDGRQILEAAAGLVRGGGGGGEGGESTTTTLSSSALAQVVSSGAIKAGGSLVSALTTHFQMLFMRGFSSVQITVGGNIRLPNALSLATGTILPFLKGVVDASSGGSADFPMSTAPPPPRPIKLYNPRKGGSSSSSGSSKPPVTPIHPGANPVDSNCAAVFLLNAPPPSTFSPPSASPMGEGSTVTSATLWYAAVTVLGEIIREPAFDELRTKQALGYIASAGAREVSAPVELCTSSSGASDIPTTVSVDSLTMEGSAFMLEGEGKGWVGGVAPTTTSFIQKAALPVGTCRLPSLYTLVQGITLPALGLEGRVEGFIDTTFPAFLGTLTEEGLKTITESLARSLEEGEKDTGEAFGGVWSKVVSRTYDWRGWAREAAGLRALTVKDVVRAWGVIVGEGRREFRGLIQGKEVEGA